MTHRLIVDGDLLLYGIVGETTFADGFTAHEVVAALAELDGDITVRLNSPGGIAEDGVAIYHALSGYPRGKVTTHVDAVAASAASVIVMGGERIVVPEASLVMIHNASGVTIGTAEAQRKTAEILDKIDGQMLTIYAAKTGMPKGEVKALMAAETWLDGEEAVELGFADHAPTEETAEPVAFDYRLYARAPEALKQFAARAERRARPGANVVDLAKRRQPKKPTPQETPEERWSGEWEHDASIRAEFVEKDAYLAFRRAEAQGRVKLFKRPMSDDRA